MPDNLGLIYKIFYICGFPLDVLYLQLKDFPVLLCGLSVVLQGKI